MLKHLAEDRSRLSVQQRARREGVCFGTQSSGPAAVCPSPPRQPTPPNEALRLKSPAWRGGVWGPPSPLRLSPRAAALQPHTLAHAGLLRGLHPGPWGGGPMVRDP